MAKRNQVEDKIRDQLVANLSFLSPDYKLIDKEYYLPNAKGTRGFVDILVSDADNHYVIIEIKRSNQSAREALHEILKYIEALKEEKKIKEEEVKAVIVSTEWKELLVPFSSFCHRTNINLKGIELTVDSQYNPIAKEEVLPIAENEGRVLSPIHGCYFYTNKDELEKGIKSIQECYKEKGLKERVIVVLECVQPKKSYYQYIAYSAHERLTEAEYWEILKTDQEQYDYTTKEIEEEQLKGKDVLERCEVNISNIEPFPHNNSLEIGYPARFAKYSDGTLFSVTEIIRSNKLAKNELLSDEQILSEIRGEQGVSQQLFDKTFRTDHKAGFSQSKKEILDCLQHNVVWQNHCRQILDYYEQLGETEPYELQTHVFVPNNILLTINRILSGEQPSTVKPAYAIIVEKNGVVKQYVGVFKWNKTCPNLQSIIDKYYDGKPFNMFLPMIWGGFEENDAKIVADLGLTYTTLLITLDKSTGIEKYVSTHILDQYEFKKVTSSSINYQYLEHLLIECPQFANDMLINHMNHTSGGIIHN